jgi:CDP-diglyceride synthetase
VGNLTSRILVAVILLPIAIAALYFGEWWLVALVVVAGVPFGQAGTTNSLRVAVVGPDRGTATQ